MAHRDRKPGFDRDQSRYGGHGPDEYARGTEEERYQGDSSGGYGTGGSAIDYHDVMGSGGYGAEGYGSAYPDLDPARVFERIDRGDVPSRRGQGPKGYERSDERIREDVSDRLYDDPHVDASEIDVGVSGGEVTLSGTVDSRDARRRAEDVAERVSGVTYVQNNLRVDRPGSTSGPGSAAAGSGSGSPGVGGTTAGHGAPGGSSGASSDVTTPTGLGSGGASTGMGATGGSAVAASISDTGGSAAGMGANPGRIGTGMADTGNEGVGISTMTGTNRTSGS